MTSTIDSPRDLGPHTGAKGQKAGAYTLIELIGTGGMGEVWRAQHDLLGREAAVKLILPEGLLALSGAEEANKRFEREARATSALRSPHTVAIYDFGVSSNRVFYYAMELLNGFSLDVLVERFGEVPPARAIHLLRGASESLSEAHGRGLIHRDVKPANIFTCSMGLTRDFVKVLDFGLVKQVMGDAATSLTAEGAIPGSPAFLAPESAKGDLTAKADVYALGCVAYWLLTANYVFSGATALEMMIGHVHVKPPPPSERTHQHIPAELEALVLDCLKKEPAERPSMKEVGERLAKLAETHRWSAADCEGWWSAHEETVRTPPKQRPAEAWSPTMRVLRVQDAVERLHRHFEKSHFDVGELDRRLARAKVVSNEATLAAVFADLPSLAEPASVPSERRSTSNGSRPAAETGLERARGAAALVPSPSELVQLVSVMSSVTRRLDLTPGIIVKAVSVMGAAVLDFRGRIGEGGVVEARCVAVMGYLEVIVPPGIQVEIVSTGFWGSVEHTGPISPEIPGGPRLRVIAVAVMGSIEVVTKSASDGPSHR